jgi:hypothetical protein
MTRETLARTSSKAHQESRLEIGYARSVARRSVGIGSKYIRYRNKTRSFVLFGFTGVYASDRSAGRRRLGSAIPRALSGRPSLSHCMTQRATVPAPYHHRCKVPKTRCITAPKAAGPSPRSKSSTVAWREQYITCRRSHSSPDGPRSGCWPALPLVPGLPTTEPQSHRLALDS